MTEEKHKRFGEPLSTNEKKDREARAYTARGGVEETAMEKHMEKVQSRFQRRRKEGKRHAWPPLMNRLLGVA